MNTDEFRVECVVPARTERARRSRSTWLLLAVLLTTSAHAEWKQTETSLAWESDGRTAWRFSFDTAKGKPFFQPVAVKGTDLTMFQPEDHPWHYALWFSWKYINGANYWEESRETGRAEGRTDWAAPRIETRPDGSVTILMELEYRHPSGRVDLKEARRLEISAPDATGAFAIDWTAEFIAGPEGAVLDRTPMPGEPDGRVNGGYAGLSVRLAPAPLAMRMVTTEGPVGPFVQNRARPAAAAAAANFSHEGRPAGGIAILSAPANSGPNAPWYLIDAGAMRFMCAAVLAPAVKTLAPGESWTLRYRVAVHSGEWTPESLRAAVAEWKPQRETSR